MSRSITKQAKKIVQRAERRARKARNKGAIDMTTRHTAPSRVPMWLRFLVTRFAVSILWGCANLFSIAGVWVSRPGRDCWPWTIAATLSQTGIRLFDWAAGQVGR